MTPATAYVTGGMDPLTAPETGRDHHARTLARAGHHEAAAWLLAGWVVHRDTETARRLPWLRWVGGQAVEVRL